MITITIPIASPSLNKYYGQHWSRKLKAMRDWRKWIWASCVEHRAEIRHLEPKRHVTIERYGARLLDRDNLIGGLKGAMDALVLERVLIDDSPAHVVVEYHQFVSKERKTIIKIQGEREWKESMKKQQNSLHADTIKDPTLRNVIQIADECL